MLGQNKSVQNVNTIVCQDIQSFGGGPRPAGVKQGSSGITFEPVAIADVAIGNCVH